jgi:hypothetical protein
MSAAPAPRTSELSEAKQDPDELRQLLNADAATLSKVPMHARENEHENRETSMTSARDACAIAGLGQSADFKVTRTLREVGNHDGTLYQHRPKRVESAYLLRG